MITYSCGRYCISYVNPGCRSCVCRCPQGAKNAKMKDEVTALKAQILSMERRQSSVVKAAVKVG